MKNFKLHISDIYIFNKIKIKFILLELFLAIISKLLNPQHENQFKRFHCCISTLTKYGRLSLFPSIKQNEKYMIFPLFLNNSGWKYV